MNSVETTNKDKDIEMKENTQSFSADYNGENMDANNTPSKEPETSDSPIPLNIDSSLRQYVMKSNFIYKYQILYFYPDIIRSLIPCFTAILESKFFMPEVANALARFGGLLINKVLVFSDKKSECIEFVKFYFNRLITRVDLFTQYLSLFKEEDVIVSSVCCALDAVI